MVGLAAVDALKDDSRYRKLFELLDIFTRGKLKDYLAFALANEALLTAHNLQHDVCVRNMRLLSMCSLATEHEEIPYAAIASDLDVPLAEVEAWVVRTITARLIDAKMDQLQSRVMITRCTHRVFGDGHWAQLQCKLTAWKGNVRSIIDTLNMTETLGK